MVDYFGVPLVPQDSPYNVCLNLKTIYVVYKPLILINMVAIGNFNSDNGYDLQGGYYVWVTLPDGIEAEGNVQT